jgi:membrane protease YdiL (CAAX protease family)
LDNLFQLSSCRLENALWAALLAAPIFCGITIFLLGLPIGSFFQTASLLSLMLLIIVYPIIEELVFRGFIQSSIVHLLKRRISFIGISLQNIITSFLFVSMHLFTHSIFWSCAVFIPSLIFGAFKDKYHSTKPSIALHIWYNFNYFLTF